MIYLQFTLGLLMYIVIAMISYANSFKTSAWFYPIGLIAALVANLAWLNITKQELDGQALVIKGIYWDVMLTAVYLAVPMIVFGVRLTVTQSIGLTLVLVGLTLTKLG